MLAAASLHPCLTGSPERVRSNHRQGKGAGMKEGGRERAGRKAGRGGRGQDVRRDTVRAFLLATISRCRNDSPTKSLPLVRASELTTHTQADICHGVVAQRGRGLASIRAIVEENKARGRIIDKAIEGLYIYSFTWVSALTEQATICLFSSCLKLNSAETGILCEIIRKFITVTDSMVIGRVINKVIIIGENIINAFLWYRVWKLLLYYEGN